MRFRDVYSVFAALLPVLLGLGLIYLYIMGELVASAVFMILGGVAVLVPGILMLVRSFHDQQRQGDHEAMLGKLTPMDIGSFEGRERRDPGPAADVDRPL